MGPSFILMRILKHFPVDSYVVYTTRYREDRGIEMSKLPCRYYYAPAHTVYTNSKYSPRIAIREWLEALPMVWKGLKIIKKEKINVLLALPGSDPGNFLLAAFIMHKLKRIPLTIYFLDNFLKSQNSKLRKFLGRFIEKAVVKAASSVFVMSERLSEYYQFTYSVHPILLPHPIDLFEIEKIKMTACCLDQKHKKSIVFCGAIYEMNLDSIQNMIKVVERLTDAEFHVYTRRSDGSLKRLGIAGKNIFNHGFVKTEEMIRIQTEADLLFLPLSFKSIYTDVIRTASPAKLPEYLATGRPILVYAPKDAYVTWYARNEGWGAIVDEPDLDKLQRMVIRMFEDEDYCKELIKKASQAVQLHDSRIVAHTFKDGIENNIFDSGKRMAREKICK
jgi:hypothetical protein